MKKLIGFGDHRTSNIVARIADEEVAHVAVGVNWFLSVCLKMGRAPCSTFRGPRTFYMKCLYLLVVTEGVFGSKYRIRVENVKFLGNFPLKSNYFFILFYTSGLSDRFGVWGRVEGLNPDCPYKITNSQPLGQPLDLLRKAFNYVYLYLFSSWEICTFSNAMMIHFPSFGVWLPTFYLQLNFFFPLSSFPPYLEFLF